MIVVRLFGGIGNQMFQYAAGRQLSFVHDVPLKLDISGFRRSSEPTPREYGLYAFNIVECFADEDEVAVFRAARAAERSRSTNWFRSIRRKPKPGPRYVREAHFHFDRSVVAVGSETYLDGYWQSEKYFEKIEDVIRGELTFKSEPHGRNADLAREIGAGRSVSIHVRRGDYARDAITNTFHGTCPPDYYAAAIGAMKKKVGNPRFFVFSDEPGWARQNLEIEPPATFVDHNGEERAHEDLRLLSLCEHHIIANSSFSWWGAWLGRKRGGIVIAPSKWFGDAPLNTKDLLPEAWIRM